MQACWRQPTLTLLDLHFIQAKIQHPSFLVHYSKLAREVRQLLSWIRTDKQTYVRSEHRYRHDRTN